MSALLTRLSAIENQSPSKSRPTTPHKGKRGHNVTVIDDEVDDRPTESVLTYRLVPRATKERILREISDGSTKLCVSAHYDFMSSLFSY
jgi:hypothetical protein